MTVLLGAVKDTTKYGAFKGVYDLIDNKIKDAYQYLIIGTNYVQYIDVNRRLKQVQYDYKKKKWYEFEEKGRADNPREIVIKYYK